MSSENRLNPCGIRPELPKRNYNKVVYQVQMKMINLIDSNTEEARKTVHTAINITIAFKPAKNQIKKRDSIPLTSVKLTCSSIKQSSEKHHQMYILHSKRKQKQIKFAVASQKATNGTYSNYANKIMYRREVNIKMIIDKQRVQNSHHYLLMCILIIYMNRYNAIDRQWNDIWLTLWFNRKKEMNSAMPFDTHITTLQNSTVAHESMAYRHTLNALSQWSIRYFMSLGFEIAIYATNIDTGTNIWTIHTYEVQKSSFVHISMPTAPQTNKRKTVKHNEKYCSLFLYVCTNIDSRPHSSIHS